MWGIDWVNIAKRECREEKENLKYLLLFRHRVIVNNADKVVVLFVDLKEILCVHLELFPPNHIVIYDK